MLQLQRRKLTEWADHDLKTNLITLGICLLLVLMSGLFSGLTLGLMSLDTLDMEVLIRSGTPAEQRRAKKILPILKKGHVLLVTLLMCNAVAMEALPIFLDSLASPVAAVLISVTAVLFFGEIVPQSICSRFGLAIGARCAPLVRLMMFLCAPVAWPLGKLVDLLLGCEHHVLYRRLELKELVQVHAEAEGLGGKLTNEEINIITGALDLTSKVALRSMTPLHKVFMISTADRLDTPTLRRILATGHSRIPVHRAGDRRDIVGLILVKELLQYRMASRDVPVSLIRMRSIPRLSAAIPMYDLLKLFQTGRTHIVILTQPTDEELACIGLQGHVGGPGAAPPPSWDGRVLPPSVNYRFGPGNLSASTWSRQSSGFNDNGGDSLTSLRPLEGQLGSGSVFGPAGSNDTSSRNGSAPPPGGALAPASSVSYNNYKQQQQQQQQPITRGVAEGGQVWEDSIVEAAEGGAGSLACSATGSSPAATQNHARKQGQKRGQGQQATDAAAADGDDAVARTERNGNARARRLKGGKGEGEGKITRLAPTSVLQRELFLSAGGATAAATTTTAAGEKDGERSHAIYVTRSSSSKIDDESEGGDGDGGTTGGGSGNCDATSSASSSGSANNTSFLSPPSAVLDMSPSEQDSSGALFAGSGDADSAFWAAERDFSAHSYNSKEPASFHRIASSSASASPSPEGSSPFLAASAPAGTSSMRMVASSAAPAAAAASQMRSELRFARAAVDTDSPVPAATGSLGQLPAFGSNVGMDGPYPGFGSAADASFMSAPSGDRARPGEPIGLITLEDVIEELIKSEIVDETDQYIDNEKRVRVNNALKTIQGSSGGVDVLRLLLPPNMQVNFGTSKDLVGGKAGAALVLGLNRAMSRGAESYLSIQSPPLGRSQGNVNGNASPLPTSRTSVASYSSFGRTGTRSEAGYDALVAPLLPGYGDYGLL